MERRVKIAAAASVLLVGTVAALLFRRDPPPPCPAVPGTSDQLVLRPQAAPQAAPDDPAWLQRGGGEASQSAPTGSQEAAPAITIVTPADAGQAPPELARSYPDNSLPGNSRWGVSMVQMLPEALPPQQAPRIHKIVDGDTLPALAERYLGSKDAAAAIFAANRDLLSDPQILPIGAELTIPAAAEQSPAKAP